jgi:cysteine synthase A
MSKLHFETIPHRSPPLHYLEIPGMPDHSRYYILGAFVLGVVVSAAYNARSLGYTRKTRDAPQDDKNRDGFFAPHAGASRANKVMHLLDFKASDAPEGSIKEGIEGCIGNTPLIKIKSLSEYTGCEILAKAEARRINWRMLHYSDFFSVPQWSGQ